MKPAIRVENLSKLYRLGSGTRGSYRTFREALVQVGAAPWWALRRWFGPGGAGAEQERSATDLWALKDVSLEIQPGEVVGIIGRNGAGKSTLLKVLSRITEPTSGRVELHGRVGSLLEVGTGFHPELTGRENIYLNGAILGMTRREIQRNFDEIVAFAEIDQFLDTPVKRYSSGMYVRLAFAVAAHLEPEILIVEEVLAVGDLAFQKKCLGKMDAISRTGRTVLFVSHNMAAVRNLCSQIIALHQGEVIFVGECAQGIAHYTNSSTCSQAAEIELSSHPNRRPGCKPIFRIIRLLDGAGNPTNQFRCGEAMTIELGVNLPTGMEEFRCGICIEDSSGGRLFSVSTTLSESVLPSFVGSKRMVCSLAELPLAPGRYTLSLNGGPPYQANADVIEQAVRFDVTEADYYGNGKIPDAAWGPLLMRSRWAVRPEA